MSNLMDKLRKKNTPQANTPSRDWTNTGSFINKPTRGWLHPDEQLLPDAGVCYGVRYVGCMAVKQSMRSLDFDTRTAVAKESISRICDAAGLKTADKKTKRSGKISKLLADQPSMHYAGSNVNLTITTECLNLLVMETGEVIANHAMPGISFASGGDPDTMDFVAYVAKDQVNGRGCFVLECGGGLAQDVITTIGQAFELRFKQYLEMKPQVMPLPNRDITNGDAWGEEEPYYNDRPGARPPSAELQTYAAHPSNIPVGGTNLIGHDDGTIYDNEAGATKKTQIYDNPRNTVVEVDPSMDSAVYDNKEGALGGDVNGDLDAFNMKPFSGSTGGKSPEKEEWFHGQMTRQQCAGILQQDGDFLVRESPSSPGQYVLSGMKGGQIKHLLLVDPEGVVRTKDRTFNSVSHLIMYHVEKGLPITSQDSELLLKNPIIRGFS